MKVNRQRKILELVNRYSIETQDDLIDRLMTEGYAVTQATISRDIRELQLTKVLTGKGTYRYVAARKEEGNTGLHFNSALIESLMSVEYAGNIIVIKTFPGLANAVAALTNFPLPRCLDVWPETTRSWWLPETRRPLN